MRCPSSLQPIAFALALAACTARPAHDPARAVRAPAAAATTKPAPTDEPKFADIVARSMPAVVLVLNTQRDGNVMYGAGMLLEHGMVLTSQHVVADAKTLGVMLYEPSRTSYTPMDGGLSRYLFENQSAVVEAHAVAGDSTSDLALIRIDADTSRFPTLPIAREPVKPGDRVLALGHPQETVWSFTQGVVGAIQQGAIQHDASISHGSSGGPLLNARGEVVGINIAKVVSEASGLAFARPIALAARYLGNRSVAALPLDLSTPEAAAMSCWRAQEIGRLEVGDCFDWDKEFEIFLSVAQEAMLIGPPAVRERIRREISDPKFKERWIEKGKRKSAAYFLGPKHPHETSPAASDPPELTRAREEARQEEARTVREHPEMRAVYADQEDPQLLKARLRLGIRVDRVVSVGSDRAWVQMAGRNADGSLYRFSELYVKIGNRWLQRLPPTKADLATLPKSFGPLLCTFKGYRAHRLEKFLRGSDSDEPPPSEVANPAPPQVTNERRPCTACVSGRLGGEI
jgi:trypsin-like peptidase